MGDNALDVYQCPFCLENMLQQDRARHESFECKILLENSGVELNDFKDRKSVYRDPTYKLRSAERDMRYVYPKNTDIRNTVRPRTTKCMYCQTTLNADIVKYHEEECVYRPVTCPDCFSSVSMKEVGNHSCKKKKGKDKRLVSHDSQTEDLSDGSAREGDSLRLDTKGVVILLKHFQDLLLDNKDHDVTLKVKDQHFRAHKNILRARSPVFAAMFTHNMAENESGEVCIDDCDPKAFGEFLKYVYVGKFEDRSPTIVTGLYYVADKYNFPDLKETCVKSLKASLTPNVISDVMTLAMAHGEDALLECAMEFFSEHMMETLMTVEWQRFIASNPSLSNELL